MKTVVQKEEVIVDANGEEKVQLVDAKTVVPGDEVIYTVTFQNISDTAAENVVITNPIAADLEYVDGSAFGPGSDIVFSVDGGTVFAAASELSVADAGVERPAEAKDFTHIRWQMQNEIPAGSQGRHPLPREAAVTVFSQGTFLHETTACGAGTHAVPRAPDRPDWPDTPSIAMKQGVP